METDLVNLMFTQFTDNLASFIANDISVVLLAMLSLLFIVFAFFKIQEIFNIGMTEGEIGAKKAFSRWQMSKGTWREPLMKEEYQRSLQDVRGEQYAKIFDEMYEERMKDR
jgi:hypothetical protein